MADEESVKEEPILEGTDLLVASVAAKSKIPLVTIPSDDCAVMVGQVIDGDQIIHPGEPHYVHQGEWIQVIPVITVAEIITIGKLQSVRDQGDDMAAFMAQHFYDLCREIADRIVSWNWTNLMSEPLPEPYKRPDVIANLSNDEMLYLLNAATAMPAEMRKNGSEPSGATSSATKTPRSQ